MSSLFDEYEAESEEFRGNFQCHRCEDYVNVAHLDHEKNELVYVCPEGHVSRVKNIV